MATSTKSISRDASLLVIGAVITLASSLLTDQLHERRDTRKDKANRHLEFNRELSKALGNRFYLTYDLLQHKGSSDTELIKKESIEYVASRQAWNQDIYTYKALLENYYGANVKKEFEDKLYQPLIDIGHYVEPENIHIEDSTIVPKILLVRDDMEKFLTNLYKLE